MSVVVCLAPVVVMLALIILVNVGYRRHLARMTPAERRAHDAETARVMQLW